MSVAYDALFELRTGVGRMGEAIHQAQSEVAGPLVRCLLVTCSPFSREVAGAPSSTLAQAAAKVRSAFLLCRRLVCKWIGYKEAVLVIKIRVVGLPLFFCFNCVNFPIPHKCIFSLVSTSKV